MSARIGVLLLAAALGAPRGVLGSAIGLSAFTSDGKPMTTDEFARYVRPFPFSNVSGRKDPLTNTGIFVTDLNDRPLPGRPWLQAGPKIVWEGADRIKISLPWPVQRDGFSLVVLDKEGQGYGDGENILLNEEIAVSEFKRFRAAAEARRKNWEPPYQPGRKFDDLESRALQAMAAAHGAKEPAARAKLYEQALTKIALAWEQMLFEHGAQIARDSKKGPSVRYGLTLDASLVDRLIDYRAIKDRLKASGANWVRLVFRPNPGDFVYANQRSFNEYDQIVGDLVESKITVMGAVLDSRFWPEPASADAMVDRIRNLAGHFKGSIHSWEIAGDVNGNWLGTDKNPVSDDAVFDILRRGAAEVKKIDPAAETVATAYWWEGTAGDDAHPTVPWLAHAASTGAFDQIDVVGVNIFPDESPMGLAFDPAFEAIARTLPGKKLMVGGFGYGEGGEPRGYWWWNPDDANSARKDILKLYLSASAAGRNSLGGFFWWNALDQILAPQSKTGLLDVYKKTIREITGK